MSLPKGKTLREAYMMKELGQEPEENWEPTAQHHLQLKPETVAQALTLCCEVAKNWGHKVFKLQRSWDSPWWSSG